MDNDRTQALASELGLTRLDRKHLTQLARSAASARELAQRLPGDLHWSEENALVFRLGGRGRAGR
jgi:hypothetical protein